MKNLIKPHLSRSVCRGFTLVELLVVITIIATLAALSMLGFARMRDSADKITATRNISQLQIANAMFATDNNGRYVAVYEFDKDANQSVNWERNSAFLSQLKGEDATLQANGQIDTTIPLSLLDPKVVRARKHLYKTLSGSFGYNHENMPGEWAQANTVRSFRILQVASPEKSAAFISSTDWIGKYSGRFLWKNGAATEGKTSDGKIAFRHGGKALVVYYDGHVGEVSPADIKAIDQKGGIKNVFWNASEK